MKKRYIAVFFMMMFSLSAAAQNGLLFNLTGSDIMQATDMLDASRENGGFATARVSAMGGAYTSLGADLSSMSINPAGLGMYRKSEAGFTASLVNSRVSNNFNPSATSNTRFSFNSIGVAVNLFNTPSNSLTFGIAYNKLDDYNYKNRFSMNGLNTSIADVFAYQMSGIPYGDLSSNADPYNNLAIGLNQWGGILAYDTFMISPVSGSNDTYYSALEANAVNNAYMDIISKGSKGEYDLSMGMSFNNVLYLGATIGIQDVYHKRDYYYTEDYSGQTQQPYVEYMGYNPYSIESGVGINFKFGAVLHPAGGLRLGLAFHTPTYFSMDKSYVASMWSKYTDEVNEYYASTLVYNYCYEYNTPAKLLLGISYTIGNYAILSLDYDRIWYQGIRTSDFDYSYRAYIRRSVKENFCGANNVRFGVEIKPVPFFSIRGGYAYYGSPYKTELQDAGYYFNSPIATTINSFSFGAGLRFNGVSLDFAAVFSTTDYTDYDVYYYDISDTDYIASPLVTNNKIKRGIYSLTLSMPF